MDYQKLRLEFYDSVANLKYYLGDYAESNILKYIKKKNISVDILKEINIIYIGINKLHDLSKKYNINDLKCIDYECTNFSIDEINYFKNNNESTYKHFFDFMKCRFINAVQICNILKYTNPNNIIYKLVDREFIKQLKNILNDYKIYPNAQPKSLFINEYGLYSLLLRSKKIEFINN